MVVAVESGSTSCELCMHRRSLKREIAGWVTQAGKETRMEFVWVGIGGFLGANARHTAGKLINHWLGTAFPFGTFIVNMTGAFVIGIIATYLSERYLDDPYLKQLLVVGFLGGYTTFSSYSLEAINLFEDGKWQLALFYIIGSNGLGILACFLGVTLTRRLILG